MNRNGTGQRYTFHNVIWRAFQAAGLSRRDIALQAGLSAEVATGQMVTCRQFFAIWDAISSLSGDLGIGFRVGKMAGEPSDNPAVYALLPYTPVTSLTRPSASPASSLSVPPKICLWKTSGTG